MNVEVTAAEPAEVEADVLALAAGGLRVRELDPLFDGRLAARGGGRGSGVAWCRSAASCARSGSPWSRSTSSTRRSCGRPRPGWCARTAAAARSPGRSTSRCRSPCTARCRRSSRARSSAATTRVAGRATRRAPAVKRFVVCGATRRSCREDRGARRAGARAGRTSRASSSTARRTSSRPRASPSARPRFPACASRSSIPPRPACRRSPPWARSSAAAPQLIVLRHEPAGAPERPRLALVGKAVTFDAGGYFLKPQSDIVRQKGDMAGGAAVLAALGAIAELELPLSVLGVLPACENMIGPDAIRPSDVITTAAGLTVEVTNPDAEGRLILADALWYARSAGRDARHRPRDADRRDAGRDGRPLRRRLRQRRQLAGRRSSTPATTPATSRGRGRCTGATAACSSRGSPTCATPRGGRTGIRSPPRPSSSASPARARGRTSTCSAPRCSTTTAATRSARGRAATACACSSSSPRAWPRRCAAGARGRRPHGVQTPAGRRIVR